MEIQYITRDKIFPDKEQPRKYFDEENLERLKQSIKDNGIEQPIIIMKDGTSYKIIDGERRWRASNGIVKTIPCIIKTPETELDILEYQLRTDCLKDELSVDELDKAIYKYYEHFDSLCKDLITSNQICSDKEICLEIAKRIGKSESRIRIAIDRFKFKEKEKDFVDNIQKKYNPDGKEFSKVNSTIAMTSGLKEKPKVRKAIIQKVLKDRKSDNFFNNNQIKEKIKKIKNLHNIDLLDENDISNIYDNIDVKVDIKKDPKYIFSNLYFDFGIFLENFMEKKFDTVKEHIQGEMLKKFIDETKQLLNYLKNLED